MNLPDPLAILKDPATLIVIGMYLLIIIWEALFPARKLPHIRYWKIKGVIAFGLFFMISTYLPVFIGPLLEPYRIINLSNFGTTTGAIAGILLYEFGMYLWHRSMHKSSLLWKGFHQMHHSAERVDTFGAFFFSPADMAGWTLLSILCFSLILGLTPEAVVIVVLVTTFFSIFQHANIKTPTWVGYIIQRPESHSYHHAREIHHSNYSDLPIFDMIFGTFHNPEKHVNEAGFYDGASSRITEMLLFRDVTKKK